ncbi:FMN-dependent NADH-azoreductase [Pseudomonas asiatica]|uniref:FMN-dependent NADH-azoreductase n=1 Tax=Pseudomonas asiatica TaxID=2219225 RepID=UPI0010C11CB4|nr:NAD(P)H-dependent oxidoreductase [Pseudomonas asiatica]
MTKILHIDASARPGLGGLPPHGAYGSYSRRLSQHFVAHWLSRQPQAHIKYRDVGANPPAPVSHAWIEAAFAPGELDERQRQALAESDTLIDELFWADVLVLGVPMYNFGMPANFKAWVDNIVRIRRTVLIDPNPSDPAHPYLPAFKGKSLPVVLLSSRGDHGMDPDGPFSAMNHLEPGVKTALGFIGIDEIHAIAIEHAAVGGPELDHSVQIALDRTTALADELLKRSSR